MKEVIIALFVIAKDQKQLIAMEPYKEKEHVALTALVRYPK